MKPVRIVVALLPFLALFLFPWPLTLVTAFAAGLVFPPVALLVGVLADVLYSPGGWWEGTLWGAGIALLAYLVRYVVRTRIM